MTNDCPYLMPAKGKRPEADIHHCSHFNCSVTVHDHKIAVPDGFMRTCAGCPIMAMLNVKVSAICLTHDFPRRLPALNEAVECFHRQTHENRELIIVNDTPGVTLEYDHPQVRVINLTERCATLGDKRNVGTEAATGAIIVQWDDDDIHLPHRMDQAVENLVDADYFEPHGIWRFPNLSHDNNGVWSSVGAYRKSAWESVGKYESVNAIEDQRLQASLREKDRVIKGTGEPKDSPCIYRWNDGQMHVSGNNKFDENYAASKSEPGTYKIEPSWKQDYAALVKEYLTPKPTFVAAIAKTPLVTKGQPRFCYYTGSNQISNKPMIESMIYSARKAGVQEDIHVLSPSECKGAINHHWPAQLGWKHMHKLVMLRDHLANLDYEYFIWLDSDTWFLRKPDISRLIRDEMFWIQGESEATDISKIRRGDWWGCPVANLDAEFRRWGVTDKRLWTTNGGMWIVRKEAINEVCAKALEVNEYCIKNIHRDSCDETALAICGHLFVKEPDMNRKELTGDVWFCDWMGRWTDVEPNTVPVTAEDWLTGEKWGPVQPAIVHAMRAKTWMRNRSEEWRPGDDLEAALNYIGVTKERVSGWLGKPCKCPAYQQKLNQVGSWLQGLVSGKPKDTAKAEIENLIGKR